MRIITTSVLAGVLSIGSLSAGSAELETQFRQITIGMERPAAIALMGSNPDAEMNANTLSINHSRLAWFGQAGRSYVVVTIFDRVIRTKACSGIPATQC